MEPKAMTYGRKEACKVTGMSIPSLDAFMRREKTPFRISAWGEKC